MNTIWINTNKISKIEVVSAKIVHYFGGYVKYYPKKKGLFGYKEGYYIEGEQGKWIGEFTKTDKHIDLGYLYHRPKIVVYGNSLEDILFRKYFDSYVEAEEFFKNTFSEFINNEKVLRICG